MVLELYIDPEARKFGFRSAWGELYATGYPEDEE
jgi:hypothetical protein